MYLFIKVYINLNFFSNTNKFYEPKEAFGPVNLFGPFKSKNNGDIILLLLFDIIRYYILL